MFLSFDPCCLNCCGHQSLAAVYPGFRVCGETGRVRLVSRPPCALWGTDGRFPKRPYPAAPEIWSAKLAKILG
jgi:hypothetical protein